MTFDLVIKGGRVISAHDDYLADVAPYSENGSLRSKPSCQANSTVDVSAAAREHIVCGTSEGETQKLRDRAGAEFESA